MILIDGLLIMVIGMGVVFSFLLMLVLLMLGSKYLPILLDQLAKRRYGKDPSASRMKVTRERAEKIRSSGDANTASKGTLDEEDELDVVIAAAIHAYLCAKEKEALEAGVRRVRRRTVWSTAHKYDMMHSRLASRGETYSF